MTSLHPEQAIHRADPAADFEAARVDRISLADAPGLVATGQIRDPRIATALLLLAGADAEHPSRSLAPRSSGAS
jgi:hypothetical protein